MAGLNADDLLQVFANVPSCELERSAVEGALIVNVAADAGLCKSRGEARRLVQSGGMYVNNTRVGDAEQTVTAEDIIDARILVLRTGKKRFHLVQVR
jgi:tyrosyl-tRNA synthetase